VGAEYASRTLYYVCELHPDMVGWIKVGEVDQRRLVPLGPCGNLWIDPGEECEGGIGCTDCMCDTGYRPSNPGVSSTCVSILCGNNQIDPGEDCDGGTGCRTDTCTCDTALGIYSPQTPPAMSCKSNVFSHFSFTLF